MVFENKLDDTAIIELQSLAVNSLGLIDSLRWLRHTSVGSLSNNRIYHLALVNNLNACFSHHPALLLMADVSQR